MANQKSKSGTAAAENTLSERIIFPATKSFAKQIEDYRFANRIGSNAEAIRRLIQAGLAAEAKKAKT